MTQHDTTRYDTKSRETMRHSFEIGTESRRTGISGPYILWCANSGEIGQERDRMKCIMGRVLNVQAHRHFEEGTIVQSIEFIHLD
jgi:hypothetical protein